MCKKCLWLKFRQVKPDIGLDITKYVLANQICSQFEN